MLCNKYLGLNFLSKMVVSFLLMAMLTACGSSYDFRRTVDSYSVNKAAPGRIRYNFAHQLSYTLTEERLANGVKIARLKSWLDGCHVIFYLDASNSVERYEFISKPTRCSISSPQLM